MENKGLFYELYDRALKMDGALDFTRLRTSYAATAEYNPFDDDPANDQNEKMMYDSFVLEKLDDACRFAELVLKKHRLHIDAHLVLAERKSFNKYMANGLLGSMLSSGRGNSAREAILVIDRKEEDAFFRLAGLQLVEQAFLEEGRHRYDVIKVQGAVDGKEKVLVKFFNIDIPMAWAGRRGIKGGAR